MGIAMGDPIDHVNLLCFISWTGFTGSIEPDPVQGGLVNGFAAR